MHSHCCTQIWAVVFLNKQLLLLNKIIVIITIMQIIIIIIILNVLFFYSSVYETTNINIYSELVCI